MLAKRHNFLKLRDLYYEIRYGIFHTYWISLKESTELMNNTEIGKIFKSIVKKLSDLGEENKMDIDGLLMNWNNSELNKNRDQIIMYPGRDGAYSFGKEGGKVRISKRSFIEWILSDAPCDEKIYGKDIRGDKEWINAIEIARTSIREITDAKVDPSYPNNLDDTIKTFLELSIGKRKPQNEKERKMLKEIQDIEAKGGMMDLPFD